MKKVYLYSDIGASKFCLNQLEQCLRSIFDQSSVTVEYITGSEITSGKLSSEGLSPDQVLLCFGGGYDLGFLESLQQERGCHEIEKFVRLGGNYLGICAGAYFASDSIEFDLNGPLEVKGERFLKFLHGKAIGPINRPFVYSTREESLHDDCLSARVDLKYDAEQRCFNTYLNGGCFFEIENKDGCEVLAEYGDFNRQDDFLSGIKGRTAVVKLRYGLGACLLSGVHFEFEPKDLKFIDEDVYSALQEENCDGQNYKLIRSLFKKTFENFSKV